MEGADLDKVKHILQDGHSKDDHYSNLVAANEKPNTKVANNEDVKDGIVKKSEVS